MKEKTKLILGGLWVMLLTLLSVWLLSLFQGEYYFSIVALVWAFAWLSGLQFNSWIAWMKEHREKNKVDG